MTKLVVGRFGMLLRRLAVRIARFEAVVFLAVLLSTASFCSPAVAIGLGSTTVWSGNEGAQNSGSHAYVAEPVVPQAISHRNAAYDSVVPLSSGDQRLSSPHQLLVPVARRYYALHLLRVSRTVKATNTPKPGTALEVVPNFADEAKAFEHYAKHSKGVVLRNGKATVKAGGADVPEFATFADYRNAARSFMSGSGGSGTLNGFKDGNLLRFDPSTGYFGVLSNKGVVRTFFRPDDGIGYFYEQFTP